MKKKITISLLFILLIFIFLPKNIYAQSTDDVNVCRSFGGQIDGTDDCNIQVSNTSEGEESCEKNKGSFWSYIGPTGLELGMCTVDTDDLRDPAITTTTYIQPGEGSEEITCGAFMGVFIRSEDNCTFVIGRGADGNTCKSIGGKVESGPSCVVDIDDLTDAVNKGAVTRTSFTILGSPSLSISSSSSSSPSSAGPSPTIDPQNVTAQANCREEGGIWIAIGCVEPTPIGIMTRLVQTGLGIMGGIAVIQFIMAGVAYQQGDEGKIEEAKGKIQATLTGIAVLVFSVLILRIIGVNVLDVVPVGLF